ncbi:MAG: CvpA family protein [Campylobacterota bacterium]|nr:CvpA family protein [Campylobacterota bacterium]
MENIAVFDIIVVSLITLLGLKGLFRGFTKEFFALVGIVGGVFIASRVAKEVGYFINGLIPMSNENTILLVGFVAALALFWIVAFSLGKVISHVFTLSGLGFIDRILGFVFGASKIFLLFSIIAYAVSQVKTINDNLKPKLKSSITFPILRDTGGYIIKLDTSGIQKDVTKKLNTAVDATKKTLTDIAQKELEEKLKKETSDEELKKKAIELKKQLEETTVEQTK